MKTDFLLLVNRLERNARRDLLVRRSIYGLFFGLLPGLALALVAGSLRLPFSAWQAAAALAGSGALAGSVWALVCRLDRRQIVLRADAILASHETITTALELERKRGRGTSAFSQAIVEDAAGLLRQSAPRRLLGPLRLRLAPYAAAAALLTAGALLFPFDLRTLFPAHGDGSQEMAQIGENLQAEGERLAQAAQGQDLGRTLELSQELAQLGKDLAARRVQPDDALDRMSDLESGLSQEYQLRTRQAQAPPGSPGTGSGAGEPGTSASPNQGESRGSEASNGSEDPALQDLGRALDRLRQAQRDLGGEGGAGDQALTPPRSRRQQDSTPGPGKGVPGDGSGQSGPNSPDQAPGGGGKSPGGEERPGDSGGSGVGTTPAPQKRGPATDITQGGRRPGLQAQGDAATEDSTRLLARSLPEWTGSRLPEETILHEYSRQAESALSRDEVPLRLRQSVKEYFTEIGVTK